MLETWFYKTAIRPVLFQFDAEEAHDLGQKIVPACRGVMDVLGNYYLGSLGEAAKLTETTIAGKKLAHPIGLAAGFDKNARLVQEFASMGFAFVELGSITALTSAGNPRPRLFRLPDDGAVINRLGLNGEGAEAVTARLKRKLEAGISIPVAINIAPSNRPSGEIIMEEDIARSFAFCKDLPLVYVTINTSCPNTHEGVLKESQQLHDVLGRVQSLNTAELPIFLKLSPDSTDEFLDRTAETARQFAVRGFVLGNTSTNREGLSTSSERLAEIGYGGLSGKPIRMRTLALVKKVWQRKSPEQEIIACGGISTADDIIDAVRAGANAVQLYTALVYEGPSLIFRLQRDLALALAKKGCTLQSLVGVDAKIR